MPQEDDGGHGRSVGGSGARAHKDGLDGVHVHTTNTSNLPVEALEIEYPLKLLRYELVGSPPRTVFDVLQVSGKEIRCRNRHDGAVPLG